MKTLTFRIVKNLLLAPVKITPLHSSLCSHTLVVSNYCCHDRSISEPAAIKIIWLWTRARYYCWQASFGLWAACCRPLGYRLYVDNFYIARHYSEISSRRAFGPVGVFGATGLPKSPLTSCLEMLFVGICGGFVTTMEGQQRSAYVRLLPFCKWRSHWTEEDEDMDRTD